jgi:hypothetical protein
VVTAWIRSGRRIDLNPSPETMESATPVVQFVGNSQIPFGRLASLFAATHPSLAASTASEQIPTIKTETDTVLLQREQQVRQSETAISRILEELEQTRKKQLELQNRLRERETTLQSQQHTLDTRERNSTVCENCTHSPPPVTPDDKLELLAPPNSVWSTEKLSWMPANRNWWLFRPPSLPSSRSSSACANN